MRAHLHSLRSASMAPLIYTRNSDQNEQGNLENHVRDRIRALVPLTLVTRLDASLDNDRRLLATFRRLNTRLPQRKKLKQMHKSKLYESGNNASGFFFRVIFFLKSASLTGQTTRKKARDRRKQKKLDAFFFTFKFCHSYMRYLKRKKLFNTQKSAYSRIFLDAFARHTN